MKFPFTFISVIKRFTPSNHSPDKSIMNRKFINLRIVLIILIAAGAAGCDKIPGGLVDYKTVDYSVTNITAPASVLFNATDSSNIISLQIKNLNTVSMVWCKINSSDGTITIKEQLLLYDDGNLPSHGDSKMNDGIFSNKFLMTRSNPSGSYQIQFFVVDNVNQTPDNVSNVGYALFQYDNGQNNLPPVISNLVIPSSVNRGTAFTFSIKADDPNGAADISAVDYQIYKPDGSLLTNSSGLSVFPMYDDGNTAQDGDISAGDQIYTYILNIPQTYPGGKWNFVIFAKDRSGATSNIITATITVN